MDGVNFSNPATFYSPEVSPTSQRAREEQGAVQPPPQQAPRVNEGPSTVTTLSSQGVELAQREAAPVNPPSAAASGSASLNTTQQSATSSSEPVASAQASEMRANAAAEAGQGALQQSSDGRLIDDASPNEDVLRS